MGLTPSAMNDRRVSGTSDCKRIVIVTITDLPEGGGHTARLRTLASALNSLGHQVEIWNEHGLTSAATENVSVSGEVAGVPFRYVLGRTERGHGFGATRMKFQAVRAIAAELRRRKTYAPVDLVVFNNLSFYDTFPLTRLARGLGARTIQCYEDERLELLPDPHGNITFARRLFGLNSWLADRYCSPMADAIFVISTYLQRKYERLSRQPQKVHLIPTIVDCEGWQLPPEEKPNPPRLFYAGYLAPQDDLDVLAQALSGLKREGFESRLAVAGCSRGQKRLEQFLADCRGLGIEENVEVLGFLRQEKLKEQIARSHLLVNLRQRSTWSISGQSTKLSEYLASGRAVLTTDIGDNARYVEHERSAFVVSPEVSPDQLARLLERVLADPELRMRVGAGGRQVAEAHFSVPVIRERLRAILAVLFNEPVSI
jgi:glycosyltransferase involved in cell wall biosynthesis